MAKKSQAEYKQWFAKGDADYWSLGILIKSKGAPETIAFLSQQVAEKYLKGFLVFHGKDYPKIHQIERLLKICARIVPDFEKLINDGVLLSECYVESRYPGDVTTKKDALHAFRASTRIKNMVLINLRSFPKK